MGYTRYERILRRMESGVDYTANELAYLCKDSSVGIGGAMRRAVNEGRVIIVGTTCTYKGYANVYRLKEDGENGE